MGLARLLSRGQSGLTAYEVSVEVHLAGGLPSFTIAGLPAAAVRESRDRVRAALDTCGLPMPPKRITAYLGPAEIPKEGGRFDLPIALAVVQAEQKLSWPTDDIEFIGELTLGGQLRPVRGALPAVLAARDVARKLVLPAANAAEAALVESAESYQAEHLLDVLDHLNGARPLPRVSRVQAPKPGRAIRRDIGEVVGQAMAKRALTIAAGGGHHLLMVGPPGSGKSMLAETFGGLLPALEADERLCVASIGSVAGYAFDGRAGERPFRAPHHTATVTSLVGGGSRPRPGEISLAHLGVLFLDELPEFSRASLEALREPLEEGVVRITRLRETVVFPARFQLLAAMNPCPCGYRGDGTDRCQCSAARLQQYRSKISGPLLDRLDLHIEVPRVGFAGAPPATALGESARIRAQVEAVRALQIDRRGQLNARLEGHRLWQLVRLETGATALLERAAEQWHLSLRSTQRIAKVARTIADFEGRDGVAREHVAEAIQLRCLDRRP